MSGPRRELEERLRDRLIVPGDPRYENARRLWNGRVDRSPAAIARCRDVGDVVTAVTVAREDGLLLAIRGGGHAVAGTASCDGGLVVDLSQAKGIRVEPERRTVRAEGGATWADLDRATQAFGLAVPGGTDSEVGIAGLTLGGGNGWLMGAFGATCDNLLSAELVTTDGRILTASAEHHPDLFWALRGGGGNFGVVTSFEYRVHPVGPVVLAGALYFSWSAARQVLRAFDELASTLPDPLTVYACLVADDTGAPAVCLALCHAGPVEDGERAVARLRRIAPLLADQVRAMLFTEWQSSMDPYRPAGRLCAMCSHFMASLPAGARDALVDHFGRAPSPLSAVIVEHCHGAIARVSPDATAFAHRRHPFHFEIIAFWDDPATTAANVAWADAFFTATRPFSTGEVYVNSLDGDEGHRVREAYGDNYDRLAAIKARYDPGNLFRCNMNIPPVPRPVPG